MEENEKTSNVFGMKLDYSVAVPVAVSAIAYIIHILDRVAEKQRKSIIAFLNDYYEAPHA